MSDLEHSATGYSKGCRCTECRTAKSDYSKAARERRIAETPFEKVPHGVKGYYNYACRCGICKEAASEKSKARRAESRNDVPHGTVNGYTNYACRCDNCAGAYRVAKRKRDLLNRYGITPGGFLELREEQGNACAICFRPFGKHPGSVDHDHTNGNVRGILCIACNSALGAVHDDPERIANLIKYLDRTDKLE